MDVTKPVKQGVQNLASKKLLVWTAVSGMILGIPAEAWVQCISIGFAGGCYLLGQGVADGRSPR